MIYNFQLLHKDFSTPTQMRFISGDDMDELDILKIFNRAWPKWEVQEIKKNKKVIYTREKKAA